VLVVPKTCPPGLGAGVLKCFRRAAGLTQPQLAEVVGVSVTSVGHAETGRLWQSRRFWEHVDKGLSAGGELTGRVIPTA
jgi:Helix-turn-helix domain